MSDSLGRRQFLGASAMAAVAGGLTNQASAQEANGASRRSPLAIDGGEKSVPVRPARQPRWGDIERQQISSAVDQATLFYWKGPQTKLLVQRFQEICPLPHVMTCSSGTAALHIAISAAGISLGDEVITSPITDIGTTIGAIYQQAVPVFADLEPSTYNLDPADVERKITPKTKAIIAVHLAGNPCQTQALRELADRHKLVLIEDCAQAWGARENGKPIGTIGHLACFSLQDSKHVTSGDGGIVATADDRFGSRLQLCGDKGMQRTGGDGLFHEMAPNYRMSELQAAFAAAQFTRLESIASRRSELGTVLTEELRSVPGVIPHEVRTDKGNRCSYWFYMLRIDPKKLKTDRAQIVRALVAEGVPASAGYIPVPIYGNPVFQNHSFFNGRWPVREMGLTQMDYSQVRCEEAESILQTGIRIALSESMTPEYARAIGQAIRKVATHLTV